jgi:hypothetical protein
MHLVYPGVVHSRMLRRLLVLTLLQDKYLLNLLKTRGQDNKIPLVRYHTLDKILCLVKVMKGVDLVEANSESLSDFLFFLQES